MKSIATAGRFALARGLIGLVLLSSAGCDGVAFFAAFQPYGSTVTISGVVSIVQITTIQGSTGVTTVTVVTFVQPGTASTIHFCGNLGSQFFVSTFTTVTFTQGPACGSVVTILVG